MKSLQYIHILLAGLITILIFGGSTVYAEKMKVPDFQVVQPSPYSFGDTINRLKEAIESENMMVIKEINAQQMLRMVGVKTNGMKQLLFFHPRFMKKIISKNKNAGIEPPLKVLVMEKPNGKVMIKYIKPTYIFQKYKGLSAVGQELEAVVKKVVTQVK